MTMNIINDLPFYIIIAAVFINVLLGIMSGVSFTVLMARSIVVTIVFSVVGFTLSEVLKKSIEIDKKNKKNRDGVVEQADGAQGSTIDIQIPPIDESELFNYKEDENNKESEEFLEVNPAYLHKFGQEEQNE